MKRITTLGMAGLLAAGTLGFAPASGDCRVDDRGTPNDDADNARLCTTAQYLSCEGAAAGKAHVYGADQGGLGHPQLVSERPTTSFTEGGGCGQVENSTASGVSQDNIHDWTFEGYVDGNIDSLAVEVHDFDLREGRGAGSIELGVRMTIDGQSPFGYETIETATGEFQAPALETIPVAIKTSDTGLTDGYQFTITGLGEALGTVRAGDGLTGQHVKITLDMPLGGHIFVWGASEIPAGILVNPTATLGTARAARG